MKLTQRILTSALSAVFALAVPAAGVLLAPAAHAQNLGVRTITGRVLTGEETPVSGATVFLKNLKSKAIRSYTSDPTGHFRFAQVTMTDDFELWTEFKGSKSAVKSISTWDTRKSLDAELRIK